MRGITDHVTYIPFRVKYYSLVRDESFKEIRYIEEIEDSDREEHVYAYLNVNNVIQMTCLGAHDYPHQFYCISSRQ
jgi:hypothetical protein